VKEIKKKKPSRPFELFKRLKLPLLLPLIALLALLTLGVFFLETKLQKGVTVGGCTLFMEDIGWPGSLQVQFENVSVQCEGIQVEAPVAVLGWHPFAAIEEGRSILQASTGEVLIRLSQMHESDEVQNSSANVLTEHIRLPSFLPIPFPVEAQLTGVIVESQTGDTLVEGQGIQGVFPHSRNFRLSTHTLFVNQYTIQKVELEGVATDTNWVLHSSMFTERGRVYTESYHPMESPTVFNGFLRGNTVPNQDTILENEHITFPLREFEVDIQVDLEKEQSVLITAEIATDSFLVPYLNPMVLSPHKISLDVQIRPNVLNVSLLAQGQTEKILFDFAGDSVGFTGLRDIGAYLQEKKVPNGTLSLHTQGFFWPLAGTCMPFNGTLSEGRVENNVLSGTVTNPYGSTVQIEVDFVDTLRTSFVGNASPQEEWVVGWGRGNMGYDSSAISGEWSWGQQARFYTRAFGAFAYGSRADTLDVFAELSKESIRFTSSSGIRVNKTLWPLEGEVYWNHPSDSLYKEGLYFQLEHPSYGKARYEMPLFQRMKVVADGIHIGESPYALLKKEGGFSPIVTGEFSWDIEENTGHITLLSKGSLYGEIAQSSLDANWSPHFFNLEEGYIHVGNESAQVSGQFQLRKQPFYNVYKTQWNDIDLLDVRMNQFNIGLWANRYAPFSLKSLILNGDLSYSADKGFQGILEGSEWKQEDIEGLFAVKGVSLQGVGDTVKASAVLESPTISALNGELLGQISKVNLPESAVRWNWESPELKAAWSGVWRKPYGFQGTFEVLGATTLPDSLGEVKDVMLDGSMTYDFETPLDLGLYGTTFKGTYIHPFVGELSWRSDLYRRELGAPRVSIPSLTITNKRNQILHGNLRYDFGQRPRLILKGSSKKWTLDVNTDFYPEYAGYRGQVNMNDLDATLRWDYSGVKTRVRVGDGDALVSLEGESDRLSGVIDSIDVAYVYPASQRAYVTQKLQGLVAVSDMDLLYEGLAISKLRNLISGVWQTDNSSVNRASKSLELDLQVVVQGQKNYLDLDYLKSNFEGDVHVSGTYPIFLLNGDINSLGGELGLTDNKYKIEEFNVQWSQENTEQGQVSARAEKIMARSCNPGEVETCFLGVVLSGTLENIGLQYEGDCGDGLGETVDPRVIASSINQDCYDGNRINPYTFLDQGTSRLLSGWVAQAGASQSKWVNWLGHIDQCNVSGVQNVFQDSVAIQDTAIVVGSDVDNSNAVYVGCRTKEFGNTGLRVGTRWGFVPNSTEEWNEREVSLEWNPKFVDNVQIDVKGKSHPTSNTNGEQEREQELSLTAGIRYIYRFWEVW
jgi:hypothetical protein